MKTFFKSLTIAAGAATIFAGMAAADGHLDGAIKARKALMQLYAFNLGQLGAMAKGEAEFDAKVAAAAANNLLAAATMDQSAMWPQGSDSTAMPGKTIAKAEIWTTYPAVVEKGKALSDAATKLAGMVGDLDSLRAGIGAAGASCGGCHKEFREKTN